MKYSEVCFLVLIIRKYSYDILISKLAKVKSIGILPFCSYIVQDWITCSLLLSNTLLRLKNSQDDGNQVSPICVKESFLGPMQQYND